jgi:small subunit ribosomal protein S21
VPQVRLKEDEPLEKALRRFKKKMNKEGLVKQMKRQEHYEKPSQRKRKKFLRAQITPQRYGDNAK